MRPERKSQLLLGVTRAKAKMIEYGVPDEHHINITQDPAKLFTISIGLLGDFAAAANRDKADHASHRELRQSLLFSAHFFDSYFQSKLNEALDPYLMLLGSASYYLCDLPGSAAVLAKRIEGECPDLEANGLEDLLLWLLQADFQSYFEEFEGPYGTLVNEISKRTLRFYEDGTGEDYILSLAEKLRAAVYEFGTPRQLLFGDVITALLRKKLENSAWKALPFYSDLPPVQWLSALQKESCIKELWPAQHLLGGAGVLRGKSAIVQMPTSAGKTKATELILRSAFLANRVSLAIIVAPFRALCHEIKNSLVEAFDNESIEVDELSDVLQTDFEIPELLGHQQILVVTPEKLLYVLRHAPELATHAGLLIFDEGHQFDAGPRGITYELLLTSLRFMLPNGTQKILISAVINNADAIGQWLIGEANVVEGTTLVPTFRSVGFASWLDQLGRVEYIDIQDMEENGFFVPRVIKRINLGRKKRERADRFFPEKDDGQTIALYLGLKLVPNGSIAIFCGRKSTAANICEKAVEVIERGVPLALPSDFSDALEVERLSHLHVENLGIEAPASKSAAHGIFSHHGNTPHGIRLAVEHAMRDNLIRFVVCTSTLAQGVNLPLRYLIVTSVYQGMECIKVRDFHNLIGRAGRAGMHTEGSILFADPDVFDKRKVSNEKWRWDQVKTLLDPSNSEPCISNLLSIFDPIVSDDKKVFIVMEPLDFAKAYINKPDDVARLATEIAVGHGDEGFSLDGVTRQVIWRINLICAVESFLLSHWEETEDGLSVANVISLAEGTLAFFLADDQKKEHIRELFQLLAENISKKIPDPARRKSYGRTLYGVQDSQAIEAWVQANIEKFLSVAGDAELLDYIWPLLILQIKDGIFLKFDNLEVLQEIARGWISGQPFSHLLTTVHNRKCRMIWGKKRRDFKIDHIVDVCEGCLAYDGALIVSALCEFVGAFEQGGTDDLINRLQLFQKRLKYGLPTETTISIYELGFSDRVIAQHIAAILQISTTQKRDIVKALKENQDEISSAIKKYPSYFQERMNHLMQ